jgi:hypothetical protein
VIRYEHDSIQAGRLGNRSGADQVAMVNGIKRSAKAEFGHGLGCQKWSNWAICLPNVTSWPNLDNRAT